MMDVESVVQRLFSLETKYYDLQDRYQALIHQYEILKEKYEAVSAGHRNGQQALYDSPSGDAGH